MEATNIVIELLFLLSGILRTRSASMSVDFFEEYKDPETLKMVTDYEKIAKHYLWGWFWPDFLSLIPMQVVHHKFYLVKLLRLTRLPDFLEFFNISLLHKYVVSLNEESSRSNQIETQYLLKCVYKIFRLILIALLLTYFLGILMYIISDSLNPENEPKTFVKTYGLNRMKDYDVVVRCMYFVLTTITTVGFGDYVPQSNVDRAFVIFLEFFGVAFFSYVTGNFIEIISNYEKKIGVIDHETELQHWLNVVESFNTKKGMSAKLIADIERHFKYFWKEYRVESISADDPILMSLPKTTRHYVRPVPNLRGM